ncbi:2-acylglycerol O-acyltransferase 2-A-like [Anastrepha obliqua]|uniref:2-acylglycerol O-acyltransferase 2-A-like n=1 Tax=Anastrepha obliqua TaxID=95512 RepID=UPI002409F249|nr:2-acylglycerol O-acyltransferase 2-A-like [Anastrepha obliqua]XP_054739870.1 2-acylglycerol O-acyltransferase 2-A-like [Anastrepha obliqua]XP_054739871.1 2-acylglycerol O-acyltransferase 2-A-like [Anastrepha obliqua]XP_054739873.1 2-acylglycerol O-acyltransferase 2-A-like [Anastrepha obliqua]XP_054739874.1 2-acylglycerol O-acyltransferase 2-A-like [Anastrepha obliqua]XP_054739875.1 2-acylglycerol O-acyltransferase 2-A-like [Anastrepha obliqua]XP_054739876.1 2-acylglycerol O-acyltransferase
MKIEWAPVHVPPRRRLQTLAAGLYVVIFMALPFLSLTITSLLLYYGNILWRLLILAYLTFIYFDHTRNFSDIHGNGFKIFRNNCIWRHFRDYFPIELIKTVDLSPDRNYILASFPHGIIGTGISCNMSSDIRKWLELFPGIRPKIGTLDMHFYTPILRELLRYWGLVSVSKDSLMYYLTKSNHPKHVDNLDGFTSNAVAILIGGAQEALDSHPGRYIITLKRRKGFVKLAIRTGSPIVPTFSFGEVEIFDQVNNPPNSWLRRFQTLTKRLTGISPLIVLGRGFFQYTFGFLPRRKHIVQVVGTPIEVEKNDLPDPEYVDKIHQQVIEQLTEMFDKYKVKYIENGKKVNLVIT